GGGVFVTFPEVTKEKATVDVKTHIENCYNHAVNGKITTQIIDTDGRCVGSDSKEIAIMAGKNIHAIQNIEVLNPKLWHPYNPNRYQLISQLMINNRVVDKTTTMIGIRTIKQTTDGGFFINGEHLYLVGANRHQAYANVGDAASSSMQERDVIDIKRGGFNAVRAAHYPQDPSFLDACDKHGLLVLECIPGWQYFNKDSVFVNRLYDVDRKMIRRDRNHPSIFLWEIALNESRYPTELAKNLYDIAHAEYPGNQMYTVGDYFGHADMVDYYDVFYKQVSKFPKDGDVMSNYKEDLIAVKPLYTREWGDGVGEKPRVQLAENEMEHVRQCRGRFDQLIGNGYFDWCMLDANERMGGHFLWSYIDYTRGSTPETMYCGIVDVNRYPKFSY
ncbi:MAG: glycoside hydrolase family 2 TIM barrel-domain containing protein, partial [Rikenellaceae bacterium]